MDHIASFIETVAAAATAVGVLLAWWQLRLAKQQAVTTFEDSVASQYREIAARLPVKALLGENLSEPEFEAALPDFYHYFDLSNEQAYLHLKRRIRYETWSEWREGIHQNLARPAFGRAWNEVSSRAPESFNELRSELASAIQHPSPSWR